MSMCSLVLRLNSHGESFNGPQVKCFVLPHMLFLGLEAGDVLVVGAVEGVHERQEKHRGDPAGMTAE